MRITRTIRKAVPMRGYFGHVDFWWRRCCSAALQAPSSRWPSPGTSTNPKAVAIASRCRASPRWQWSPSPPAAASTVPMAEATAVAGRVAYVASYVDYPASVTKGAAADVILNQVRNGSADRQHRPRREEAPARPRPKAANTPSCRPTAMSRSPASTGSAAGSIQLVVDGARRHRETAGDTQIPGILQPWSRPSGEKRNEGDWRARLDSNQRPPA